VHIENNVPFLIPTIPGCYFDHLQGPFCYASFKFLSPLMSDSDAEIHYAQVEFLVGFHLLIFYCNAQNIEQLLAYQAAFSIFNNILCISN
jgi:hypothetical protein